MPLLSSLTHTGTRVGGQRERETQRREAGCAYYPRDYVSARGNKWWVVENAREEREMWERKPPAKRVNWEKVGTESPWEPDWEGVLGLGSGKGKETQRAVGREDVSQLLTTQREDGEVMDVDNANDAKAWVDDDDGDHSYWLLRGPETPSIIDFLTSCQPSASSPSPAEILHDKIISLRHKIASFASIQCRPFTGDLDPRIDARGLFQRALVMVKLRVPRSGSPEDLAVLYGMEDEEARKWREGVEGGVGRTAAMNEVGVFFYLFVSIGVINGV